MMLNQYLTRIEQGKAINLDRFIQALPFSDPQHWRTVYQAVRVRGGYHLTILDQESHQALYAPVNKDRISAARSGRSHDFSGSFSHVLVHNHRCASPAPFVVLSDVFGFTCSGELLGKRAVIIENQENFYRYQAFLEVLGCPELAESCDILLGAGNQICHQLNRPFLAQYDVIYCAQDVDLGGLTIYQTLKKTLPQCRWLAPADWAPYRERFKMVPKNGEQLASAIELARQLGLAQEAELMNQTRAFLEQEALLPPLIQD